MFQFLKILSKKLSKIWLISDKIAELKSKYKINKYEFPKKL